MANGKGGPKIPRNLKPDLEQVNSLLQDVSTKLSNLHQMDDTFHLKIDIQGEDKFETLQKSLQELNGTTKAAQKINAALVANLKTRNDSETRLNEAMKRTSDQVKSSREEQFKLTKEIKISSDTLLGYEHELDKAQKQMHLGTNLTKKQVKENSDLIDQMKDLKKNIENEKDSLGEKMEKDIELHDEEKKGLKLLELQKKAVKELDEQWVVIAKTLGNQVLSALDKIGTGLMTLAIDAVFFSLGKLKEGFLKVYDLMERTTKAVGQFNLSMGGTTAGLAETRKEAFKVEGQLRGLTGGELGVGLKMWEETSQAIGFVGGDFDKMATKATLAGRALGIGGQGAGELTRTLSQMGETSADTTHSMVQISDAANDAGVSVAQFGKELVGSKNFMASFGKAGKKTFLDTAAFAKKLGVSLQSLERFTDMTDTFQSTAEAAAKMNTVFGTNINSMEMMLEQDPSKRLEMVRKQFKDQGKSWESMNRQERKFFAQTMNLSEEEAAGVLNSKLTLDQFQKQQAKAAKKKTSDEDKIRKGLAATAETLHNFGQSWDKVTAAVGRLIKPILKVFGLSDDLEGKMSFGKRMEEVFGKLVGFIDKIGKNEKVQAFIKMIADDVQSLFGTFLSSGPEVDKTTGKIVDTVGEFAAGVSELYKAGKVFVKEVFTKENLEFAMTAFGFIAKNIKPIIVGFLAIKGAMGAVSIIKGLNSMTTLLSGGKGLLPILKGMGPHLKNFGSSLVDGAKFVGGAFKNVGMAAFEGAKSLGGALLNAGKQALQFAGKMAGPAGAVAAAAAAGLAIGTFIRGIEISGVSIDDWVQGLMDSTADFFGGLWISFKESKLGQWMGLGTSTSSALSEAGFGGTKKEETATAQLAVLEKIASGQRVSDKEISDISYLASENKNAYALALSKVSGDKQSFGQVKDMLDAFEKRTGKNLSSDQNKKNEAAAAKAEKEGKGGLTGEGFMKGGENFGKNAKSLGSATMDIGTNLGKAVGLNGQPAPQGPPVPTIATPLSPAAAAAMATPQGPKAEEKPVNLAKKEDKKKAGPAGTTLIAGDVYLDGNLVGRHLLRGAASK